MGRIAAARGAVYKLSVRSREQQVTERPVGASVYINIIIDNRFCTIQQKGQIKAPPSFLTSKRVELAFRRPKANPFSREIDKK